LNKTAEKGIWRHKI